MRKTALIGFFLVAALAAIAQQTITIDSTYITITNGIFYETHIFEYEDGTQTSERIRLGDSTQVFTLKKDAIANQAATMAADIKVTAEYPRKVTELIRQGKAVKTQLKRSPLDSIWKPARAEMVDQDWMIRDAGDLQKVVFSQTQAGVTRYKVDTFTIRSMDFLGDIIRLNNYRNSGKPLDLYRFPNGRYYNATRTIQLYKKAAGPSGTQARAGQPYSDLYTRQWMIPAPNDVGTYYWDGKLLIWQPAPKAKKKK